MTDSERIPVGDRLVIYRRGKKRLWTAEFSKDGQHCRKSLKTANKKVAMERAAKLLGKLVDGSLEPSPTPTTFQEAIERYLAFLQTEERARKTLVKYAGIFKILVAFLQGQRITHLGQFTTAVFDRFRAYRKQTKMLKTLYVEGIVIKQLFRWAKTRGLLAHNPIENYKLRKPRQEPKGGPSLDQLHQLLATGEGVLRAKVAVLAMTGMRAGELQRLRREDVDLENNWIRIVDRPDGRTKTRSSRKVPIHPRLREILEPLAHRPAGLFFTAAPSERYPKGDHPINIKRLNSRFQALLKQLGLPTGRHGGFTLHSLRHSFEAIAVNANIPQRVIDTWLGHRSDKSMASVYYRLSDEESQRFIRQVPFGNGQPAAEAGISKEDVR